MLSLDQSDIGVSVVQERQVKCTKHMSVITKICTSHYCDNYRELCNKCTEEDSFHSKYHMPWTTAIQEALRLGRVTVTGLQGVRARKNQEMQQNIIHNPGLFELQAKLDEISILINKKIQGFRNNIKKIYSNHVKQKLDELDQIIQKSQQFLQRQVKNLEQSNYKHLNIFFKSDFLYQLKFYQSYFNQIFVKKIRSFKTAIENDRIFSLITNFEQNLNKIFTFDKQNNNNQDKIHQYHLFNNEDGQCCLYYFKENPEKLIKEVFRKRIAAMNRISHSKMLLPQNCQYKWIGIPQSVFYPYYNCYYIFGQGNKPSKVIVKYDHIKQADEIFTVVKFMEKERKNFGVCMLKGQIFIIGGQNDKQGCLSRCQKFVPLYNNQVYLIHSLRQKSSRHSVTTYKNKYILKFGGIRKVQDPHYKKQNEQNTSVNYSSPEIYSLQTQQWSIIPFNIENKLQFYLYPAIFKTEHRNFLIILGGDPLNNVNQGNKQRPGYEIVVEQNKGEIDQIKIRTHQSKIKFDQTVFNSTIILQDEDHQCIFLKCIGNDEFKLGRLKIQI